MATKKVAKKIGYLHKVTAYYASAVDIDATEATSLEYAIDSVDDFELLNYDIITKEVKEF